jgi:ABC-type Na+ efflux pump permease subunit
MIGRVMHIARREWREQLRQPAMLSVVTALFVAIAFIVVSALVILDAIAARPERSEALGAWFPSFTSDTSSAVETFAGFVVGASTWLVFTQLLGIVAVMAGHAVLHDRQVGTLPFLLLAPVRRIELLTGKVLGVLLPPLVPYVVVSGSAAAYASTLAVAQPHLALLPPNPAWMVAFLIGGPIWAAFVATLCAIVSSVSHDVRTAQQVVWFVMFFATFGCGYLLAGLMPDGAGVQAVVAGMGAVATLGALFAGSQVISRDLSR